MASTLFTPRERSQFSFTKALKASAEGTLTGSLEADMLGEAANSAERPFAASGGFFLPFELLGRDMTAAGTAGSQYAVGTDKPQALDILRPASAVLRAGATVYNSKDNLALPRVSATGTAVWLADESSVISPSQTTVGSISFVPKNVASFTTISGQMMRQGDNLDAFLRREMIRSLGTALDTAVLAGTGINGQPLGIHGTSGIGAQAGADLAWAGVLAMLEGVSLGNATNVTWVAAPAVRTLLAARPRLTGGSIPIWHNGQIEQYDAVSLSNAPTATLTAGDFSQVIVAVFGDGVTVEVDPFNDFGRGFIAYRGWLSCDVAIATAGAFSVATSVT